MKEITNSKTTSIQQVAYNTKRHGFFRVLLLAGFLCFGLVVLAQGFPANSVLVVGQKNCRACKEALPRLAYYTPKWEAKNLAVRYYSLDSLPQDYSAYPVAVTRLPQRWESPLIKKLKTYATPTYYWTNAQGVLIAETATAAAMQLEMIKRSATRQGNPKVLDSKAVNGENANPKPNRM